MIIIPEKKLVIITPPKTASTSLMIAVKNRYPDAVFPHRHMEADGVPEEYAHFRKVGIIRHPVDRLYSMYRFMKVFNTDGPNKWGGHGQRLADEVKDRSFEEWIWTNEYPFTQPIDDDGKYISKYDVLRKKPETQKSQMDYIRPDLGTEIMPFEHIAVFAKSLDLDLPHLRKSDPDGGLPILSKKTIDHLRKYMNDDFVYYFKFYGIM